MNWRYVVTGLISVGYATAMLIHTHLFLPTNPPADTAAMAAFVVGLQAIGMVILGGGAAYAIVRFRLASPAVLVGLFTALSISDHFVSGPEFTVLYIGWWFFFVAVVGAVTVVEYAIREWLGFYPPEPIM